MLDTKTYTLTEVCSTIKDGNIFVTFFMNEQTYIYYQNNKIRVKNSKTSMSLSTEDFKEIFKNCRFFDVEEDLDIDLIKDKEYYSWKQ